MSRPWWHVDDPVHGPIDLRRLLLTAVALGAVLVAAHFVEKALR